MTDRAELLEAINSLDTKLTAALNSGVTALQAAIVALSQSLSDVRLEQEKRNATFASRERVHELANLITAQTLQSARHADQLKDLQTNQARMSITLTTLEQRLSEQASHDSDNRANFLSSWLGWTVIVFLAVAGPIITAIVQHLSH